MLNSQNESKGETVLMAADGINDAMKAAFEKCDVLLDCSPGAQAPKMARFAVDFKMHYANLTEYVDETDEITRLAKDADTGFILQTGLAPGFINVLAMSLYNQFVEKYENETVEKIGMKVGALTAHARAQDRDRALQVGCDDYDTKPVDFPRLLGKIDALLGRDRNDG